MSQLVVRQTTNPNLIKTLIVINLLMYISINFIYKEFPDLLPRYTHLINLSFIGYLSQTYRKSLMQPLDGFERLEFGKDQVYLLLLLLSPAGIFFLLTSVFDVSLPVIIIGFTSAIVLGILLIYKSAGDKILLKDQTVTFIHGMVNKKSKTLPYEQIGSLHLTAATDGITITSVDGKVKETYRFMGNIDNLHKLLQQRAREAQAVGDTSDKTHSIEELIDRRLKGIITDEEFNALMDKASQIAN